MNRSTIIVLLSLVSGGVLLLLMIGAYVIILPSFRSLEDQQARRDLSRAREQVNNELDQLGTTAADYSGWDDAYRFVQSGDSMFLETKLNAPIFTRLNLHFLIYFNTSGEIRYGKFLTPDRKSEIPLPPDLLAAVRRHFNSFPLDPPQKLTGILPLADGWMLVAIHQVLKSDYSGPATGYLAMGRRLDAAEVQRISNVLQLPVSIFPLDGPEVSSFLEILQVAADRSHVIPQGDSIAGYTLFQDDRGTPIMVARITAPRDIYQRGVLAINYFLLFALVVALILGTFIYDVLRRRHLLLVTLREAKTQAEAANHAKGEFLTNMGHEIRTPMTVFLVSIEHLLQIDQDEHRRELLTLANESGQRLQLLMEDILDLSRIEAGTIEIEEETFNLRDCVHCAASMFSLSAQKKNLRFDAGVAADVPARIEGDPKRLRQVLINLIDNAIKFTPQGVVRVGVRTLDKTLEFSIIDTGIGIPEEKVDIIFERFMQADSSSTRLHGGTGLGLTISRALVELMGGKIFVQSQRGGGTTFIFTLPLKEGSVKEGREKIDGSFARTIPSSGIRQISNQSPVGQ